MGHLYHGYVKLPEGKHKSKNLTMEPWIELMGLSENRVYSQL